MQIDYPEKYFYFSTKCLSVTLEAPWREASNEYQYLFLRRNKKNIGNFLVESKDISSAMF